MELKQNYLAQHPYYHIYKVELDNLTRVTSYKNIRKDDLSPEAQEVWDYKEELLSNRMTSNFYDRSESNNPYAWVE